MFAAIGRALSGLASPVIDLFKHRREVKHIERMGELKYRQAAQDARAEAARQGRAMTHEWEMAHIRNAGIKDEWILLLLSVPLIMAFVPGGSLLVAAGFEALGTTPAWYQWLVLVVFCAVFGVRLTSGAARRLLKK